MSNIGFIGDSNSWKQITGISKGVGGSWISADSAWIGKGGVWYKILDKITPAPIFSIDDGYYSYKQNVDIVSSNGSVIYYTLDGSDPTALSTQYTSTLTLDHGITIKAIAINNGILSTISVLNVTITYPDPVSSGFLSYNVGSDSYSWL